MKFTYLTSTVMVCVALTASFTAKASDETSAASAISQLHNDSPMTWSNAGPDEFNSLLGHSFSVRNLENNTADLTLIEIIPGGDDKNRPDFLPRKQAVTAVFQVTEGDVSWLNKTGAQMVDVWHHELGSEKILLIVTPEQNGGYSIEVTFN